MVINMQQLPLKLPLLLDGATGTNLIECGMDRGSCPEQWILEHPQALIDLQRSYAESGSDAVYAPTFGANRVTLSHYGLQDKVGEINRQLVSLTREAVGDKVLVGGDMSSTALQIEPFGDASFEELIDVYREQATALKEAGADFIIAETLLSLYDARAALLGAGDTGLPVFISITLQKNQRTLSGASPLSCLIALQSMGAAAFGINCSMGADGMAELIRPLLPYARIPVIAKPNGGMLVDGKLQNILSPENFAKYMKNILDSGVRIVGGCCGTTPAHIAALADLLSNYVPPVLPTVNDTLTVCSEREVFSLTANGIKLSEPVLCTSDLEDDLADVEDDGFDAALVRVDSIDDASELACDTVMSHIPIAICTDNADALDAALKLYQGRAMVSADSALSRDILENTAKKYGAVLL